VRANVSLRERNNGGSSRDYVNTTRILKYRTPAADYANAPAWMGTGTRPGNLADKSVVPIDFIVMPKVLVGVPLGWHCTRGGGEAAASRMNKHNE